MYTHSHRAKYGAMVSAYGNVHGDGNGGAGDIGGRSGGVCTLKQNRVETTAVMIM